MNIIRALMVAAAWWIIASTHSAPLWSDGGDLDVRPLSAPQWSQIYGTMPSDCGKADGSPSPDVRTVLVVPEDEFSAPERLTVDQVLAEKRGWVVAYCTNIS